MDVGRILVLVLVGLECLFSDQLFTTMMSVINLFLILCVSLYNQQ